MLTKSDRKTFIDFRDSLTVYTMGFRITCRVDGVSSYKQPATGYGTLVSIVFGLIGMCGTD